MKGMILNHSLELLVAIEVHTSFIAMRKRTMQRTYLSKEVRANAGQEMIDLIKERREYWDELLEILDHYYSASLNNEIHEIPGIQSPAA